MAQEQWTAVDSYIEKLFFAPDFALEAALDSSKAAGLPTINVSPAQGKLLNLLARMQGARKILELGTLGGYSTIWLARALPPDGRLISLEIDPKRAEIARANIARAELANAVEIRVGPATDSLQKLLAEGRGPFDLIFIDADKPGYAEYLTWSLKLSRPGTLIHRRQRGAQGRCGRCRQHRRKRAGHPEIQRSSGYGKTRDHHRDPDGGLQRL